MNAPQPRPLSDGDAIFTPAGWAKHCARRNALEDLRRDFEQRWQSLLADYAAEKSRIEREYW